MLLKRVALMCVLVLIVAGNLVSAQDATPIPTPQSQSESYFQMGMAALEKNDVGKAREIFGLAISSDPNNWQAMYMRALLFDCTRESDAENAIDTYNRALSVNPDAAMVYLSTGNCYANTGNLELAFQNYHIALSLDPTIGENMLNALHTAIAAAISALN